MPPDRQSARRFETRGAPAVVQADDTPDLRDDATTPMGALVDYLIDASDALDELDLDRVQRNHRAALALLDDMLPDGVGEAGR